MRTCRRAATESSSEAERRGVGTVGWRYGFSVTMAQNNYGMVKALPTIVRPFHPGAPRCGTLSNKRIFIPCR
jgi:hypothetical protein